MRTHPVTKLFPPMDADAFKALKESIKEYGVKTPVWTYKGKLIDGRHRWKACQQLGIECPTREWKGKGSLVMFVLQLNLERRHLTKKERGLVAVNMLPLLEREAAARTKAAAKKGGQTAGKGRPKEQAKDSGRARVPSGKATSKPEAVRATDQAAKATGVSGRYVRNLKKIQKQAPDLIPHVEDDTLTVPQAGFVATIEDPKERARMVKETKKHGFDEAVELHEERELGPARRAKQIGNALERCRKGAGKLAQDMTQCLSLLKGAEEAGNRVTVQEEAWSTFSSNVGLILSTAKQLREYSK